MRRPALPVSGAGLGSSVVTAALVDCVETVVEMVVIMRTVEAMEAVEGTMPPMVAMAIVHTNPPMVETQLDGLARISPKVIGSLMERLP